MKIYKITNLINSKQYIGKTTQSIEERWSQHCSKSSKILISIMIKEYGKENFTIEEIDSAKTFEELDSKEKYWIKELNTIFPKGYNEEPHRKDSLKRIKLDFKASDELVNIGKLSKILNVSPQTIRNWESKGLIKSYRTLKNHRRYKLSEVYSNFKQE